MLFLSENLSDQLSVYVSEAVVAASVVECQPLVIQAKQARARAMPSEAASSFGGSRLLTLEWGETLNDWAGGGQQPNKTGQRWELCCSTFMGCDNASKFHEACDAHHYTLTVARVAGNNASNSGNFTFGGFVRTDPMF